MRDKRYYPGARRLLLSHDKNGYLEKGNYYKLSVLSGSSNCQVFYDIDHICMHWGRMLKIITVIPEAYSSGLPFQTAVLMEKT